MKHIVLSAITTLALSAVAANATQFYADEEGRVFTQAAEGRVKVDAPDATVVNASSPEFLLGKETAPNLKISATDNPDMWVKLGVRIQGTYENYQRDYEDSAKTDTDVWDAYLRRTRFEVAAGFSKHVSFTMDVRNDKANYQDKGEQTFNVGDAYLKISKPFDTSLVNFRLYRGKIDVSRTETVKSAYVLHYDRPHVADEAAQYISHNRRGTNAKMYGDWKKKFHYEIAAGDGVHSGKLKDALGNSFDGKLSQTSFFYGGKIVFSPFDGWEETKRTETYFAKGKHFEIGASYWRSPDIAYDDGVVSQKIDHDLINVELSAHYKGAFIQAEYFDFDGVVKSWGDRETGKSNGWYVTGEYVIEDLAYTAPFFRYENWTKWDGKGDWDMESAIVGINWYLRGNSTKVGLVAQRDTYGKELGDYTDSRFKLTTQWFF